MLDFDDNSNLTHTILAFYLPLIFSLLSIISCVLFLFTYLKYEKLRINSGKIIFILGFCIFFLTAHLLASLFYEVDKSTSVSDETYKTPGWCTALGVITNLVIYNFLLLNLFLCHNLLCCIIYKESTFHKRYRIYLSLSALLSIILTIILAVFDEIGYGPLGFCWLRNEKVSQIIHIITVCVIFPLAIGILIYVYSKEHFIKTHSLYYYTEDNFTQNNRKMFIRINLGYIFVFTLTWLPSSIIYVLDFIFKRKDWNIESFWFEVVRAIALDFLCISAFSMFLIRMNEPIVRKAFSRYILLFGSKKKGQEEEDIGKSQNLDSVEVKEENSVNLAENLLAEKEKIEFKKPKALQKNIIQPQQYEVLLMLKKNSSQGEQFTFLKKKKATLLKSSSRVISENERTESKLLLIKVLLGSIFLIRNDINNQMVTINTKIPWEDHYYMDLTNLKSKIGDLIRLLMKNENEAIDKMTEIFQEHLLEDVTCINMASLVFSSIKSLYNIDNIKLFDSFYPIENLRTLECIDYDPFSLREEISINNFISYNNRFYIKLLSDSRVNFLTESFLKNLHEHYSKTKANTFLAPLICLCNLEFIKNKPIKVAIYENLIGNICLKDLYALIILDGLNIVHKKFKNGIAISTEIFDISEYQMENVLKLKYKDKSLLMRVMKTDLKFLLAKDITNYQIHLIFSQNPQKILKTSMENKSVNNPYEEMNSSQMSLVNQRKCGLKFECFLEDYECRVSIHNFLNTHANLDKQPLNVDNGTKIGTETNLFNENKPTIKKKGSGLNENFSPINPDVYAKNLMDALQDLL